MSTSQNGWPVLEQRTTGSLPRLRKWIVPGTGRHLVIRDGSAGFLLVLLTLWFHERVQRIDEGIWDEWGYAFRPVRGQSGGYSNHASGTAIDLNATRHPLGVAGTFTFRVGPRKVAAYARVRLHLARVFRGTIRWGGDYSNRVDAMHFELNQPLAACEARARLLTKTKRGRRILAANPGAKDVIFS